MLLPHFVKLDLSLSPPLLGYVLHLLNLDILGLIKFLLFGQSLFLQISLGLFASKIYFGELVHFVL